MNDTFSVVGARISEFVPITIFLQNTIINIPDWHILTIKHCYLPIFSPYSLTEFSNMIVFGSAEVIENHVPDSGNINIYNIKRQVQYEPKLQRWVVV